MNKLSINPTKKYKTRDGRRVKLDSRPRLSINHTHNAIIGGYVYGGEYIGYTAWDYLTGRYLSSGEHRLDLIAVD